MFIRSRDNAHSASWSQPTRIARTYVIDLGSRAGAISSGATFACLKPIQPEARMATGHRGHGSASKTINPDRAAKSAAQYTPRREAVKRFPWASTTQTTGLPLMPIET